MKLKTRISLKGNYPKGTLTFLITKINKLISNLALLEVL